MSAPGSQTQWYLARDGRQIGPVSEAELAKLIELGHLRPTDLLWRDGFPDWRPAMVVFPGRSAGEATHPPGTAGSAQPAARQSVITARGERGSGKAASEGGAQRRRRARVAVVLLVVAAMLGAGWYAYPHRGRLLDYITSMVSFSRSGPMAVADRKSLDAPPLAGLRGTPDAVDTALQGTALWRVIKREFPDWYAQRLNEAAAMARDNKDDAAIGQHVARKLVELRRQQAANALSATLPKLRAVAVAFFENLTKLRRHSTEACYGFISQGEAHPAIVAMLQGSEHTAHLQAQLTGVFEAIAEGRKQPRVYPQPRQADYDMLASDLAKMGWTQADMQLFSDERALSRAAPEKVCQMVHDWFAAQLALKDQEAQMRLLVESLRPVVAG
jgi:hypothetical protein